jgi:hypothetical protein
MAGIIAAAAITAAATVTVGAIKNETQKKMNAANIDNMKADQRLKTLNSAQKQALDYRVANAKTDTERLAIYEDTLARLGSSTIDSTGNIYAAGNFIDTAKKYLVAKFDGATWSYVGGRISFASPGPIRCIRTDNSGNLYIAGEFRNTKGNQYVVKYDGSKWNELGGQNGIMANGYIRSMASDKAGNIYAAGIMDILDYTNSNKYKTGRSILGTDYNGSGMFISGSFFWQNTAAITSITLTSDPTYTGNWTTSTSFALYGIKG